MPADQSLFDFTSIAVHSKLTHIHWLRGCNLVLVKRLTADEIQCVGGVFDRHNGVHLGGIEQGFVINREVTAGNSALDRQLRANLVREQTGTMDSELRRAVEYFLDQTQDA
jgi:hypothetical protein